MLMLALAPSAGAAVQGDEPGEAVGGRLVHEGEPVEGVEIVVEDASGEEVGTAVSDEDGRWEIPVPEAGTYSVTLAVASLPEGIELATVRATLPSVRGGAKVGRHRPCSNSASGSAARLQAHFERLLNLTVEGLRFGLVIAHRCRRPLVDLRRDGLDNFAHGELVTSGR